MLKSYQNWHATLFIGIILCIFIITFPIGIVLIAITPIVYLKDKKSGKWKCSNCKDTYILKE